MTFVNQKMINKLIIRKLLNIKLVKERHYSGVTFLLSHS